MRRGIKYALSLFVIVYVLKIIDVFYLGSDPDSMFMAKICAIAVLFFIVFNIEEKKPPYIGFTTQKLGKNILLGLFLPVIISGCYLLPGILLKRVSALGHEIHFTLDVLSFSVIAFYIIDSIADEAVYRGYIQKKFLHLGLWKAIFIQSVLYGFANLMWVFYVFWDFDAGTWYSGASASIIIVYAIAFVSLAFYIAVLTGYVYARTQSLVPIIIPHTLFGVFNLFVVSHGNFIELEVVAFPVLYFGGLIILIGLLGRGKEVETAESEHGLPE